MYEAQYPDEVAGIVFVDPAFVMISRLTVSDGAKVKTAQPTPAPPIFLGKAFGLEDDPNFQKLSPRDRDLHNWFIARSRDQAALQSNHETSMQCVEQADAFSQEHPRPLGERPLVDVSNEEMRSPDYVRLQSQLLSLSQNSKELIAEKNGHFVIIDRPDVVIDAISRVVQSVHNNAKL